MKNYNKQNQDQIDIYEKNGTKYDFNFKLAHNLRVRTRQAFKSQNAEKSKKKTFNSIRCSQSFLKKWNLYQLHGTMEEIYGSMWTLDPCYPLSKTIVSNETDMFISTHCICLRPMFLIKVVQKGLELIIDCAYCKK